LIASTIAWKGKRPQPDAENGNPHTEHGVTMRSFRTCRSSDRHTPASVRMMNPNATLGFGEQPAEMARTPHDQEQVEVEEGEKDLAGARRDELIAQTPMVSHRLRMAMTADVYPAPADEKHARISQRMAGSQPH